MRRIHHLSSPARALVALSLALVGMTSCSVMTKEEKLSRERQVDGVLQQRDYRIRVNYMVPLRSGGRALDGSYSIEVKDGKISSHLPYFGVATSARYGGGNPLSFEKEYHSYDEKVNGGRNPSREAVIKVRTEEDYFTYYITVFPGGKADIRVTSRNRDPVSYYGEIELPSAN